MTPGTRIRCRTTIPWRKRAGCEGIIVQPATDGTYPQPGRRQVLVLLDDDPLHATVRGAWTFVADRDDVEIV